MLIGLVFIMKYLLLKGLFCHIAKILFQNSDILSSFLNGSTYLDFTGQWSIYRYIFGDRSFLNAGMKLVYGNREKPLKSR